MRSSSSGSVSDANMSEIAEAGVSADQPARTPPIRNPTSRRTDFLPPSRHISGSKIFIRRRKADAIESRDNIKERNVCFVPIPPDLYATLARFGRINITWVQLKNQTAARKQSSD